MKTFFKVAIQLLFLLMLSTFCRESAPSNVFTQAQKDSLSKTFQRYIQQTEYDFKHADWSPLTPEDKASFEHLDYFPYDPSWRFEGVIHVYEKQQSTTVLGSKSGDIRPALRYGYFEFRKNGRSYRLEVLKILPGKPGGKAHLFLGFWDKTSGRQTYGGGRYIDVEKKGQNNYVVDFNYAYNPYCAYSHRYSCAIPPLENRLDLAVTAGEKRYTPKDLKNKRP